MKIIFAGTPDFAAVHLDALIRRGADVRAAFTRPDRPRGRGHRPSPSPVAEAALAAGIPVYRPATLRNNLEAVRLIKDLGADLLIVVAYGLILPDEIIAAPRLGTINVHASLLPRWRGAAPIQRALWAGDERTGVTLMKVAREVDAGDVIAAAELGIEPDDTAESLSRKLAELGAGLLADSLPDIGNLIARAVPQDPALATAAAKLTREEAFLDFSLEPRVLARRVRAYLPWPVARFTLGGATVLVHGAEDPGVPCRVPPGLIVKADREGLDVAAGGGILRITRAQLPGKKIMSFGELLNSRKEMFAPGGKAGS